jgi:hypothetical protein
MDEKKLCNTTALSPVKHSKRNNKECSWHNMSKECSLTVLEETKDKTFLSAVSIELAEHISYRSIKACSLKCVHCLINSGVYPDNLGPSTTKTIV